MSHECVGNTICPNFQNHGDVYLLTGFSETKDPEARLGSPSGGRTKFLIAVTPERSLAGWSYGANNELFIYALPNNGTTVSIDFESEVGETLLSSTNRTLQVLVRQKKPTDKSVVAALQTGIIRKIALPLLFCSDSLSIDSDDITTLARGANTEGFIKTSTGTLTTEQTRAGLKKIIFTQENNDLLFRGNHAKDLRSSTFNGQFQSGLSKVVRTCLLEAPISSFEEFPRSIIFEIEKVGVAGERTSESYRIIIDSYSDNKNLVNQEIDKIIDLVPRGKHVVSNDNITYAWDDGRIKKTIDPTASAVANSLTFTNRSTTGNLIIIFNIAVVIALLALVVRRHASKQR